VTAVPAFANDNKVWIFKENKWKFLNLFFLVHSQCGNYVAYKINVLINQSNQQGMFKELENFSLISFVNENKVLILQEI
jgi:hypothetical protein